MVLMINEDDGTDENSTENNVNNIDDLNINEPNENLERFKEFIQAFGLPNFIALILIVVGLIVAGILYVIKKDTPVEEKQVLVPIEYINQDAYSVYNSLEKLIAQENTMYIKKDNEDIKDIFPTFYSNIPNIANRTLLSTEREFNSSSEGMSNLTLAGIGFEKETGNTYSITNPATNLIQMVFSTEGGKSYYTINYKYLYDTYGKYISEDWQDFLTTSIKCNDGIQLAPSPTKLANWIVGWSNFMKKYPNFTMNDKIQPNYHKFAEVFVTTNFNSDNYITPEGKKAYEKILSESNKDTEEYKLINNCYEALKRNDLHPNSEFFKYLYEYTNNKIYDDSYNELKAKEEEEAARFTYNDGYSTQEVNYNENNYNSYNNYNQNNYQNNSTQQTGEPDFGPYMGRLQERIKENWNPPKGNESKRVVVLFKLNRQGFLQSYEIKESSGNSYVDQAAIQALEVTQPFGPLPQNFRGNSVDVQFTFDYNIKERY